MKTICFVTRCHPARPGMLEKCIESVKAQSCSDYTHFLLKDDKTKKGYGVEKANESLRRASPLNGQYIVVLDDDDALISSLFVADFKELVKGKQPDIVFFRGVGGNFRVLPPNDCWGKPPVRGKIGSFCFAVSKDFWDRHIKFWEKSGGYPKMGDFTFISKCYHSTKNVLWMDRIVATTQQGASRGKSECETSQS